MVYECDRCNAVLPANVFACPCCEENFDEAVPVDATFPKTGFHAAVTREQAQEEELQANLAQAEADIAALISHSQVLQSQVATLTNRLTVLEMAGREDKRRFMDHVKHVKEALDYIQINGPSSAAGQ